MERFNALGRGAQLMLIGGVLLFISLFLPWQDFGNEFSDAVGVDASFNGWRGIGFILGLVTIVLLAWLIVRLASVNIPLPVSTAMTGALLGVLILVFAIIKLLSILGDAVTIWAWVGLALAIVVAVGAFQVVQEARERAARPQQKLRRHPRPRAQRRRQGLRPTRRPHRRWRRLRQPRKPR